MQAPVTRRNRQVIMTLNDTADTEKVGRSKFASKYQDYFERLLDKQDPLAYVHPFVRRKKVEFRTVCISPYQENVDAAKPVIPITLTHFDRGPGMRLDEVTLMGVSFVITRDEKREILIEPGPDHRDYILARLRTSGELLGRCLRDGAFKDLI